MTHNALIFLFNSFFLFAVMNSYAQLEYHDPYIKEMKWEKDSRIYLTLLNDSTYILNSQDLPHVSIMSDLQKKEESTYYPVSLSSDYVKFLSRQNEEKQSGIPGTNKTLWTEIHSVIGGGWIHFIHCLTYTLELQQLDLKAPLMKRPESKWKPNPITQTYLQTYKWKYYLPVTQREALKEYRTREKNQDLGDLLSIPPDFMQLFLTTSDRQYKKMVRKHEYRNISRIDLVKILLGARYLGEAQISYIKTMVLKSVLQNSSINLPSILVFDEYNAAVAMSLDEIGYRIRKIIFYNAGSLDTAEKESRQQAIGEWIEKINNQNKENFQRMLRQFMK